MLSLLPWQPLLVVLAVSIAVRGDPFVASRKVTFLPVQRIPAVQNHCVDLRGGATKSSNVEEEWEEEEEEEEEDEYDEMEDEIEEEEEEEDEEETHDAALAAAALESVKKTKAKAEKSKRDNVKREFASHLPVKKKKSSGGMKKLIPYIVRASLNPFTLVSMVRAYWASFFDFNYVDKRKSSGQDLRSALEEKAKRSSPGPNKGKRKMKRGQAKTLSDLPQLSS